ncbi:hypothetical protein GCM10011341_38910 [Frigidibacter albus]|nr:hypothetical protein GCM10011341_38910 [Frigidibacter albus]
MRVDRSRRLVFAVVSDCWCGLTGDRPGHGEQDVFFAWSRSGRRRADLLRSPRDGNRNRLPSSIPFQADHTGLRQDLKFRHDGAALAFIERRAQQDYKFFGRPPTRERFNGALNDGHPRPSSPSLVFAPPQSEFR